MDLILQVQKKLLIDTSRYKKTLRVISKINYVNNDYYKSRKLISYKVILRVIIDNNGK